MGQFMNNPVTNSTDISFAEKGCVAGGQEVLATPLGKLKAADAYLARITVGPWEVRKLRMDELKGMIGGLVREADPAAVLGDPHVCGMVRHLWGEPGVNRLKRRMEENALRETTGQQSQGNSASPA